jgi:murein DD-endopeptidase MepM/ murein hydrolase activator NlpD
MYFVAMRIQRRIAVACFFIYATRIANAQQHSARPASTASAATEEPRLTILPHFPAGGELVRLTLDHVPPSDDSITTIRGMLAGEPLHFVADTLNTFAALGAVPVEVSDSAVATVYLERMSGAVDSARLFLRYPHQAPPPPTPAARSRTRAPGASRLKVDPKFTRRMDEETTARVEHENELARDVGRLAQETPKLYTEPFLRPRPTRITSPFGSGRVFNGRLQSSHLGIDFRGAAGEPIFATNRGVVALVDSFFLAGNVVYVNHGNGLMTGYFHMTRQEVAVGDTVERGQEIGLVGATGRVTGPHLHLSARYGTLTINPGELFNLGAPFVDGPREVPPEPSKAKSTRKKSKPKP